MSEKEKRTLIGDIKKNILDKIGKEDIKKGDRSRFSFDYTDDKSQSILEQPFYTYPKKDKAKKTPETEVEEFQQKFAEIYEKVFTEPKKPVRYTKRGLEELGLTFMSPGLAASYFAAKDTPENLKKRKYVEGYSDIAKAILRGGPKFVQSAGEFVLAPIDYTFGTEFLTKFNKYMDDELIKPLGEAETLPGGVSELLVQYAIPTSVATKITSGAKQWQQIKKLQKFMGTSKASKIAGSMAEGAFILGFSEPFVQSGVRPDSGLIIKPIDTTGLKGKDLALATIKNKIRFAADGTLIGGGFPLVGKIGQQVYKYGAKPVLKTGVNVAGGTLNTVAKVASVDKYVLPNLAKAVREYGVKKPLTNIVTPLVIGAWTRSNPYKVYKQLPPFEEWRMLSKTNPNKVLSTVKSFDDFLSKFRSFADSPEVGAIKEQTRNIIKAKSRRMNKALEDIERSYYKLAKSFETRYNKNTTSPVGQKYFNDQIMEYLQGSRKLSTLPKELQFAADDINTNLNQLRDAFSAALPKSKKFGDLKKDLLKRGNTYMRTSFEIFDNPMFAPYPEVRKKAQDYITQKVVRGNKDMKEAAISMFPNVSVAKAYKQYADKLIDNILYTGKAEAIDPVKAMREIGTKFLRNDDYRFLNTGKELPDEIRKLMGQQSSLKSSVLTTTAEMMGEVYTKKGMDYLAKELLKSGRAFKDEALAYGKIVAPTQVNKLPSIGVLPSEMQGLYVSQELANALRGTGGALDKLIRSSIYRHLLQFKVLTQMGKTVFSPQTQVRNVYSAGFFPFTNGHIGGRSSVSDSFRIVLEDIFGPGKISKKKLFDFVEKEIRLGTMDENIVASELGAVLNDIKKGSANTLDGLFQRFNKAPLIKTATRLYAGGDSGWKIYGRQWVKSQMSEVLPNAKEAIAYARYMGQKLDDFDPMTNAKYTYDDLLDQISAYEIRNVYPTYSKVPEFIQTIRKLPIANFVAFPAEILRTAVNIMDFGLKQAMHPNPRIRQIGLRRLMAATLGFGGTGAGITALSQWATGTSAEQWDAYKRSFAADWDRNANLVAFTGFKNGKAKAFNFSYFSPYDYLQKPMTAILQKAEQQNLNPQETSDYVMSMMLASDGPIMEMLRPFISEQLGLEALIDVQPGGYLIGGRGGRTSEGVRIYSESDDIGTKLQKSMMHLMNAIEPGAVSTGQKLKKGLSEDLTKSGQPIELKDELLALFSGVRIINIDVLRSMDYKVGEFNRLMRAVDDTEKIYSAENFQNRGPEQIVKEFEQMQDEAFRIQKDMFQIIKDAKTIGLSDFEIREKLKEQKMSRKYINNLMNGEFTPANYSDARFKKKVKAVELQARNLTKKDPNVGYLPNEDYLYPKLQLDIVKLKYQNKSLGKPYKYKTKKNPNTAGFFDGPTIKQRLKNLIPFGGFGAPEPRSEIQTPPLGNTPMPKTAANTQPKDPRTNLTRTETALLSPTEKVIAGRT